MMVESFMLPVVGLPSEKPLPTRAAHSGIVSDCIASGTNIQIRFNTLSIILLLCIDFLHILYLLLMFTLRAFILLCVLREVY